MLSGGSRHGSAAAAASSSLANSKTFCVYDRRSREKNRQKNLETSGLDINGFIQLLHKEFPCHSYKTFVLVTTDRKVLDFDRFEELKDGSTLYMLLHEDQDLSVATEENITYTPHFHTLTESGTYEYHASEGHKALPYALAELIDNALSATAQNKTRTIEIRMMFDETLGKPAVIVLDNGCGMTSKKLNNWAVYKLSKFTREDSSFSSQQESYVRPKPVPRNLNSDLSYFGVGGKQAIFFIGDSVRMITKPLGSPDVHELVLSTEEFKRKEMNKEDIFCGIIKNRKPGDSSHVNKDDEHFLHALIAEERGKESFTAVVITGVKPDDITFMKQEFDVVTTRLAHIYHYYIHGVNGNDRRVTTINSDDLPKIDIQVTLREKPPRCPRAINLREVEDDMQTLYVSSAVNTFEFRASTGPDGGTVEGLIRYHPFLYDKETYPAAQQLDEDDYDNESGLLNRARGKKPIFECFWNGRLIPSTTVSEFDWCSSKGSTVPAECYSRLSGVLFTDDTFKVTQNKLTFMELELELKKKETIFTTVVNGQKTAKRGNIQKEFTQWLQSCHEKFDKQVKFLGYKETITRTDVPAKKNPWAVFSSIEWDGKTYKAGQLVKSQKTKPLLHGTVAHFWLCGNHTGDVFATGGQVEIIHEPKALYDMTKIIPISKIDKTATIEAIKKYIDSDIVKLPEKLKVEWPEGNSLCQKAILPAGSPLGPLRIEILNKKGESLFRMPSVGTGAGVKLSVMFSVVKHGPEGDNTITTFTAQFSSKYGFWFKKIETLTELGKYSLCLNTIVNDNNSTVFGGRKLPSHVLKFTVTEGDAEGFVMDAVSPTLHVGVPFDIPLQIKDSYGHSTAPPPNLQPDLKCSGLELSYTTVDSSGTTLIIRGVKAIGKVLNYQQIKSHDLKVTLRGLKKDTQTVKISLLPGNPHSLYVTPKEHPIAVENGNPLMFNVEVHDEAGNVTANPKQIVRCQIPGLPPTTTDCSSTGAGQLLTKPINLKIIKGEPQVLQVKFDMVNQKSITPATKELKVLPSTQVSMMELCSQDDEHLVLKNNEKIEWPAGGLLENLFFKLYDEAGRDVALTAEIATMIKVNWTGDRNLKHLAQGKLPNIQVPMQVTEERFCEVSYQARNVSVSFTIVPRPDEPVRLKATLPQSAVKLGETLSGNINLELVDQYDNLTKMLTPACVKQMTVKAEGLNTSAIAFIWQECSSSVVVKGVCFQAGSPGPRELCFKYCDYVEHVVIKVTAGDPAKLILVSRHEEALQVLNNNSIPKPFIVQLCDEWGNPCQDQRVVVELKSSPPGLKLMTSVTSQPVDTEGKAAFVVNRMNGLKGYYQLMFSGSFNKKPIPGPSVNLTVIADPNKPVSLSVRYDTTAKFPAGGVFPVFSVTVVSDEGSPIITLNPAAVSMLLWKGVSAGKVPPENATEMKCNKPMENERNDCFHFREKQIPEHVGKHTIQFSLRIGVTEVLFSDQIPINVVANQPVKLGPDSPTTSPVVSYSKDIANRTLVENMTLSIMDQYGNPAGQDLDGKVVISIMSSDEERNIILPLFEGKTNSLQVGLVNGKAHITKLAIMENSPGENGSTYILLFKPEVSMVSLPLAPFKLPFHFYNDAENHQKMSELTKKKAELTNAVNIYLEIFTTSSELLKLLTSQCLSASQKEADLRKELSKMKIITEPLSKENIDRLMTEKIAETEKILRMPRRTCSIPDPFKGQQDVLGKVGHLAIVKEDAAAWVISWHIGRDMDCVVTRTTEAAKRIYHNTQGKQQVMALDSVFVSRENRPLPHIRNGHMLFDPPGNPVFARELLIYPNHADNCKIVFKNLLGDAILIDDLDSANSYRKSVVENNSGCPTILTRRGERVGSRGIFGGAHNKAPPRNTLKMFGAPFPPQYDTLEEQKELLSQYRAVVEKKEEAENERNEHLKNMRSSENKTKQQEMDEKKRQLKAIEAQLASMQRRAVRRVHEMSPESSDISAKRAKKST